MSEARVWVMGITDAGLASLTPDHRSLLESAGFIAGGERHLAFVDGFKAEKFLLKSNLAELADKLRGRISGEAGGRDGLSVVLASGDPLFFGIGKYLSEKLGRGKIKVVPNVSSIQQAFARAGLSWEDAALVSVHGRPLDRLLDAPADSVKLGIFTDDKNGPAEVAAFLLARGWPSDAQAWVAENLDGRDERVSVYALGELQGRSFSPLNVMLCRRPALADPAATFAFALPDEDFFQRKPEQGLITKAEVRAVSLSKLRLHPGAMVWDIGAGSGAVSVECARLASRGHVWAVEKNPADCENVRKNVEKYGTLNVSVVEGRAPEALETLPADPDAVFVGGSAGQMADILSLCCGRLRPRGSLVVNTVTLENTAETLQWFKGSSLEWSFLQMQVSRSKPILDLNRLDALNPVFVFWGMKRT